MCEIKAMRGICLIGDNYLMVHRDDLLIQNLALLPDVKQQPKMIKEGKVSQYSSFYFSH